MLSPYVGNNSLTNYIVSGAVAEVASSGIWTPTEVLKGRMQIATHGKPMTTMETIKSIYKAEGIRGFMHGYFMGLVVFVPHSVVWWVSYERIREYMSGNNVSSLTALQYGEAAAIATTTAVIATNFLDVVKTRQQLAHSPEVAKLRPTDTQGVRQIAKNLIKENGFWRAMTKGMGMRFISTVPSSALAMAIMETLHPDPSIAMVQED